MARVKVDLPSAFLFETSVPVRITDINYGGHLGNDALLTILHEARVRFFCSMNYSETNVEGVGIIMTDAAIVYRSEVFYGDTLAIQIAVSDIQATRCDILYLVTTAGSGKEVARAKTGIAFFDYQKRSIVAMPEGFRRRFERSSTRAEGQ